MASNFEDFEEELGEAQEKPFNTTYFVRLLRYLNPYKRSLVVVGLFILIGTVATLLEPYLLGLIIDRGVMNKDLTLIFILLGVLLVFRFLSWGAGYLRMFKINQVGQSVLYDLRSQLFEHIQQLSLRFYDNRPVGKIMSRVTSDVGTINELISEGVIFAIHGKGLFVAAKKEQAETGPLVSFSEDMIQRGMIPSSRDSS